MGAPAKVSLSWRLAGAMNLLVSIVLAAKLCVAPLETPLTSAQTALAIGYFFSLLTWAEAELVSWAHVRFGYALECDGLAPGGDYDGEDEERVAVLRHEEKNVDSSEDSACSREQLPVPPLSPDIMTVLRACAELSGIMVLMYICDRTSLVGKGPKHQSKPEFWGVMIFLFVASMFTLRRTKEADGASVKPLQREQTEEWKGWMQVMFLLYHYWVATEMYNAIRIYIAAYIWMTGFGNFSYYYIKRDFGLPRFLQMMWRLNFLVIFVCLTLNNEYMLYYICPLHTLFTIMVYGTLYLGSEHNQARPLFLCAKIGAVFVLSLCIWDSPKVVFETLTAPFTPLLRYSGDQYKATLRNGDPLPPLHEWRFRSSLDHLVWIFGMVVAYSFPKFDAWVNALDGSVADAKQPQSLVRWSVVGAVLALFFAWVRYVFLLPKFEYNTLHPYTSFIPIGCYILLRNSTRWLRERVLPAWGEVGKYTLETYICQFHIWMRTTGENGNPKHLLVLTPNIDTPAWFWINFALVTAMYLYLSMRLFKVTVALKEIVLPSDVPKIMSNMARVAVGAMGLAMLGHVTRSAFAPTAGPMGAHGALAAIASG